MMGTPSKKAKIETHEESAEMVSEVSSGEIPFPQPRTFGAEDLLNRLCIGREKDEEFRKTFLAGVGELKEELDGMCRNTNSLLSGRFDELVEEYREKTMRLRDYMEDTLHDLYTYSKNSNLKNKEWSLVQEMTSVMDEPVNKCKRLTAHVDILKTQLRDQQVQSRIKLSSQLDQCYDKNMNQLKDDNIVWLKDGKAILEAINEDYCEKVKKALSEDIKLFAKQVRKNFRIPKSISMAHTETSNSVYDGAQRDADSVLRKACNSHSRRLQSICKKSYDGFENGFRDIVGEYKIQQLQDLYPLIPKWRKAFLATWTISAEFSAIFQKYCGKVKVLVTKAKAKEQVPQIV